MSVFLSSTRAPSSGAPAVGAGAAVLGLGSWWLPVRRPPMSGVTADDAVRGESAVLTFRVPNESETGSPTTGLTVALPDLTSVSTAVMPGWTATLDRDTAAGTVRSVTWKAEPGTGVGTDQFGLFVLRAKLPDSAAVSFPATQTYADGTVVRWDQPEAVGGEEPGTRRPHWTRLPVRRRPAVALGPGTGHCRACAGRRRPAGFRARRGRRPAAEAGMNRFIRPVLGLLVAILLSLAGAAVASAHAALIATDPPENAALATGPDHVSATFNEEMQPEFARDDGGGSDGNIWSTGGPEVHGAGRQHRRAAVGTGGHLFTSATRATSADGHVVAGAWSFRLTQSGAGEPGPRQRGSGSASGLPAWRSWPAPSC